MNSEVFPLIEIDSHPGEGTTNFLRVDVPYLRIFRNHDGSGYFVMVEHDAFRNEFQIKRGTLEKGDIESLLGQLERSGFFEMKDAYEEAVYDGGTQTITVNLPEKIKTVKLLRYTGKQSKERIPESFYDLYTWLVEFVAPKIFTTQSFKGEK